MRLIDADELIEKSWDVDCRIGYVQVVDVGDILESPTIDAVEVVRCKDCRKNPKIAWVGCPMAGKSMVFDGGFCHMGERREDGNQ